jgi:hypothetical protein
MALTVYGLSLWCSSWLVGSLLAQIVSLFFCVAGGVVVYGGLLYALRLQELEMLVGKVIVKIRG